MSKQTLYDGSFAVRGPRLWNIVPKNVKAVDSFDLLKSEKPSGCVFFALILDKPPVTGYESSWSNSLADYLPVR